MPVRVQALVEALAAEAREWPVVPLHGVGPDGTCRCGGLESCHGGRNAGKHPINAGWQLVRLTADEIRRAEHEHPGSNFGTRTGGTLFVFDVDPRNGGDRALADDERAVAPLPATVRTLTGGGGER